MKTEIIDNIKKNLTSNKQWVLVIGDLMLDHYVFGDITRISPEAPVPVVKKIDEQYRLGGAANVAANLRGFGIKTSIIGAIGKDSNGEILEALLKERHITTTGILKTNNITTTKSRVLSGQQQILRIDDENVQNVNEQQLIKKINISLVNKPSIIILSDYNKGLLNKQCIQKIIKLAKQNKIPVIADPKGNEIEKYHGVTVLTPNKKEALLLSQDINLTDEKLNAKLRSYSKKYNIESIAMTQGHLGIKLIKQNKTTIIPATKPKFIYDLSGAGDTVVASIAAGIIAGLNIHNALELANHAAGYVISKVGTTAIDINDLIATLKKENAEQSSKIVTLEMLEKKIVSLKKQKLTIGFTNGCFDILHAGHVMYLEKAKSKVDFLILALNSDSSVKTLKGPLRPIINEQDRARVLSALESVDAVITFNESTPLKLIKKIKPDLLIKGSDYKINQVVGSKEIKAWGGKVELVPLLTGKSTSNIIKLIN